MPRSRPSPQLFPECVAQHTVSFEVDDGTPLSSDYPGLVLPDSLSHAVRQRQTEFLAGRLSVREALRACAPALAEVNIGIGRHGAPLFPPGIVGSITHCRGMASAAVARSIDVRGIGLDAEPILDEAQSESIRESIADRREHSAIMRATGWNAATALTAIFSAKEAIFKSLYPEVGRYFDFRDVWLDAFAAGTRSFTARLCVALTPALPQGMRIAGRFSFEGPSLFTGIVLP